VNTEIVRQITPQVAMTRKGKIERTWQLYHDQYVWMKRKDVIWRVNQINVGEPMATPMRALSGQLFFSHEHSVTLEDFVYIKLHPTIRYVHLPTMYTFSARQINTQIFRNAFLTWPKRIFAMKDEGPIRPSRFILKYNRVPTLNSLLAAQEAFLVAA
jgi:hypothetical protein